MRLLGCLARLLALLSAGLFVLIGTVWLLGFNLGQQLINPAAYKQVFAQQRLYERLPALIAAQLTLQATYRPAEPLEEGAAAADEAGLEGGPPPSIAALSSSDWEVILAALFPPEELRAQTEAVIDQAFAYLGASGQTTPTITISLVPLKTRLSGDGGRQALTQLVDAQPACTPAQLEEVTRVEPQELPLCRPPASRRAIYLAAAQAALADLVAEMPEQADLAQALRSPDDPAPADETPPGNQGPPDPRRVYQALRWVLRLSFLAPFLFLLLAGLLGGPALSSRLAWWGFPCLVLGLIGIGLAIAVGPVIRHGFAVFVANRLPPYAAPGVAQVGLDLATGLGRQVARWIGIEAAVLALLGLALLVVSSRQKQSAAGRIPGVPRPA